MRRRRRCRRRRLEDQLGAVEDLPLEERLEGPQVARHLDYVVVVAVGLVVLALVMNECVSVDNRACDTSVAHPRDQCDPGDCMGGHAGELDNRSQHPHHLETALSSDMGVSDVVALPILAASGAINRINRA